MMGQQRVAFRFGRIVAVAALLIVWTSARARGEVVRDQRFHFTMRVPDGFEPVPGRAGVRNILLAYAKVDPDGGLPLGIVNVERLNGTIGPEQPAMPMPHPPDARYLPGQWKGQTVYVFAGSTDVSGSRYAFRGVQLPVAGEAIQVFVGVPVADAGRVDGLLASVLAGFDAPVGWTAAPERGDRAAGGWFTSGILIAGLLWGVLIRFALRRVGRADPVADRRVQRASRLGLIAAAVGFGLIVGGAVAVFLAGHSVPTEPDADRRGRLLATGAMQMSGWIGAITAGVCWAASGRRRTAGPEEAAAP